ncbi:hypothetical protein [Achromobacter insuavis]|uniref:hypothetical protein n=1 Tax=Achromobacter insuavis TaxID=1287735 RepID=UPI001F13748F|nr:hypothetical protein [Achromobacter insuavis]
MKWILTLAALISIAAGTTLGAFGHWDVLVISFLSAIFLLACANLDRIAEFTASANGVTAKTRDVVQRAEHTIQELQVLATQLAAMSLSLIQRSGRIGGYSRQDAERFKASTLAVLRDLSISEERIAETLADWHLLLDYDHASFIVSLVNVKHKGNPNAAALHTSITGLDHFPRAHALRAKLDEYQFRDNEINEALLDYEHYEAHRELRRPTYWDDRFKLIYQH